VTHHHDRLEDARIRVSVPGVGARSYVLEVKRRLTPGLATTVRSNHELPLMVVAPYISDAVGAVLRGMAVDYVDMVGNGCLRWPGVYIDVRGKRPAKNSVQSGPERGDRAFTRAGLQVLFVLLTQPAAASTKLRQLAEASGTSLGTAQGVVGELEQTGALVPTSTGRRLHRPGQLYDRWVEAYATRLSPSLYLRSFRADRLDWWRAARSEDPDLVVGGEAAAAALDTMLRPESVTFYVTRTPTQLVRQHRLVPVPRKEANVHLKRRFWDEQVVRGSKGLAPTTLVFADLVTSGEPRLREHAERLRRADARLLELDGS
ncbi:Transcriptional regulator, AbiEi 2 antitoxin, Type IV TA system, partial [Klenkia terrae]